MMDGVSSLGKHRTLYSPHRSSECHHIKDPLDRKCSLQQRKDSFLLFIFVNTDSCFQLNVPLTSYSLYTSSVPFTAVNKGPGVSLGALHQAGYLAGKVPSFAISIWFSCTGLPPNSEHAWLVGPWKLLDGSVVKYLLQVVPK